MLLDRDQFVDRLDLLGVGESVLSDAAGRVRDERAQLGQFLTPAPVAKVMAGLIGPVPRDVRLLDAGAGAGMLTAATITDFCNRTPEHRPRHIHAVCWELDRTMLPRLQRTLAGTDLMANECGVRFTYDLRHDNFITETATEAANETGDLFDYEQSGKPMATYDVAILNPPYRKLGSDSPERRQLSAVGIETSNLYAAFVWLAARQLRIGGQLVAITPRSFMNGSYFRPLRKFLTREMSLCDMHVFESRTAAFSRDAVLQENVIYRLTRGRSNGSDASVRITASTGPDLDDASKRLARFDEIVDPRDADQVFHVIPDDIDAALVQRMRALPATLTDLGVTASTGRLVEFRARNQVGRYEPCKGGASVPLIYPRHVKFGKLGWPVIGKSATARKPDAVLDDENDFALPAGWYVTLKRFSSKEERRRIVAAPVDPDELPGDRVAFENKVNVLHANGGPLERTLALGLCAYLNATFTDACFRIFSGHTQVNAGDLDRLRFPDRQTLQRIGRTLSKGDALSDPAAIDQTITKLVFHVMNQSDPTAAKQKTQAARDALKQLGVDKAQQNDRSALTLLALLDLQPDRAWANAQQPLLGVTQIIDWIATHYGKRYAPNTRETIRRFTLHQFVAEGLAVLNPNEPERPINSPNNAYQLHEQALDVLRAFGTPGFEQQAAMFREGAVDRSRLRSATRDLDTIPVRLPDGAELALSAGGQNLLIKEIIETFAPRFTPGGRVLYVGDAGEKHLLHDKKSMKALGLNLDPHGRMPDVVIHHTRCDWLVLVEAVTSHGPVNSLRHDQLKTLFAASNAGLVFVTAFLDRAAMKSYLPEIAWETEVWVADAPDHLIHFNGERFLGPYEGRSL